MIPFFKIIFTGNSGCAKTHDSEFSQYRMALRGRKLSWLVHVGGFRLELHSTVREMQDTSNHQWSHEKTSCAIIKPIRAGITAREILNCLFDRAWNNSMALHNIRGVHILPRIGFGFEPDDMKYDDDACIVLFLDQAYTLDIITVIQRFAVKEIKNLKTDDIPGRTHYFEAGSWTPILPNGGHDIMLGSTRTSALGFHTPLGPTRLSGVYPLRTRTGHTSTPSDAEEHTIMEIHTGQSDAEDRTWGPRSSHNTINYTAWSLNS